MTEEKKQVACHEHKCMSGATEQSEHGKNIGHREKEKQRFGELSGEIYCTSLLVHEYTSQSF